MRVELGSQIEIAIVPNGTITWFCGGGILIRCIDTIPNHLKT